ncbi:Ig-like domain-containing protein [Paenibacillus monticola]|uniref:SLH domain-containing protein n=1 Tax=Paenibacillus monticola TaxID=2666075 RepID=A0A7X2H6E0_9BACL|nr:Ig-like domain-containing protein [Paenibacillus monticola]MRN54275.1 hypothetical protein [Paenibacillus monticola]
MKRKISIWTVLILAGDLLLGVGSASVGIGASAVYAASEFGMVTTPSAGASYVSIGSSLRLSFDRQVNPQTGNIIITPQGSSDPFVTIPIGTSGLIGSSKDYEIKWDASLHFIPNKTYIVTVPKGLFKDSTGAESSLTSWSFTTAPEINTGITVSNFTPANNARVDSGALAQISLKLDKPLQKGGGAIRLLSSADNSIIQEFIMKDGESGVAMVSDTASTTVTLSLTNKLATGSNYYVLIDSYAFKDADDKTFSGISSGNVWSFSTIGAAAIPVTLNPAAGAVSVSASGALQLNFDRPMMPATGYITVSPGTADDARTRWVNVNSTAVTGGGSKNILLSPASTANPLLSNTLYTVTIPQGAFYDQDGNVFPATAPYTWSFTTASLTSVGVTSLIPADRSESVDINKAITLTFNRDVIYNSSIVKSVALYKSSGIQTPVTITQSGTTAGAKEYTIKPTAALEYNSTYYIDIAKGAFSDATDPASIYGGLSGANSWSFRTLALDSTAPILTSAQLDNNRTIRLKYNETLNSAVALLPSSFQVTVNDENRAIESVSIQGDSVLVILSTGIAVGQVVKLSYTGGLRTIQDSSGNPVSTFSLKSITNSIESSMPLPQEGRITGKSVALKFNDSLKAVSTYAQSQFLVTADGYSLGVNSISLSGNTVYLGLNSEASSGQTVRVSYNAGSYPLQNTLGQNIADFADFYIRNSNDATLPLFQSAEGAGTKIVLTYNEGMSVTSLPMISQFSVLVGTTPNYVTNVAVSGNLVTLTLTSSLTVGQNATLSYVPGVAGLSDLNGNRAGYINLKPVTVSSSTSVAEISSATVTGDELTVTFNKSMQASTNLYVNQFGVRADGNNLGVQSYDLSGKILKLTLSSVVKTGQTVDLSYMSGSTPINDSSGKLLSSFSVLSVQNLTGTSTGTGSRPTYLGTLAASEFGEEYPLLKSDSSNATDERSVYSQSVKKYNLTTERLSSSYDYLYKLGTSTLAFEVPSTELAAYVTIPLKPLLDAVNRNSSAKLAIRYGDSLYSVALGDIDMSGLAASLIADSNNISLVFRMEKVPTGTFTPLEQKLQAQGLQNVTSLVDFRLTAMITGNTSSVNVLSVPGEYTVRTTSILNSAQSSIARLDLTYNDAAYLPTKSSTLGSYTILRARTVGNQVVGTFLSTRTFTDMSKHWSNTIVAELAAKNIIDSSYGNTFKPEQKITRAEFAVMLSRGLGLQGDRDTAQRFRDIQPSTQTGDYIGAAAKAGIITGNTDATFRPNENITREQLAIMMIRAMEYTKNPITLSSTSASALTAFKDKSKIQSQSAEFVAKAVQSGIILGMTTTEFQPQGNATRAQAAVMLQRMLDKADYL